MKFLNSTKFLTINGFLILSYILWNYLLRYRLPRDLDTLSLVAYGYFVTLFLFFLILTLNKITKLFLHHQSFSLLIRLQEYLLKSLKTFDAYIKDTLNIDLLLIEQKTSLYFEKNPFLIKLLFFGFNVLPKAIVLSSLIYDIAFTYKIHYFYQSLVLLLFPLGLNYFVYNFKQLYHNQLELISECIDVSCYSEGNEIYAEPISLKHYIENTARIRRLNLSDEFNCLLTLKYAYTQELLSKIDISKYALDYKKMLLRFTHLTELLIKLKIFLDTFQDYSSRLDFALNLIVYLGYTLCWGYIIFYAFPL